MNCKGIPGEIRGVQGKGWARTCSWGVALTCARSLAALWKNSHPLSDSASSLLHSSSRRALLDTVLCTQYWSLDACQGRRTGTSDGQQAKRTRQTARLRNHLWALLWTDPKDQRLWNRLECQRLTPRSVTLNLAHRARSRRAGERGNQERGCQTRRLPLQPSRILTKQLTPSGTSPDPTRQEQGAEQYTTPHAHLIHSSPRFPTPRLAGGKGCSTSTDCRPQPDCAWT